MPWFFPWSDNIKKRSCRYLLQRYLGQFLEEKLTLEQLSVDLYNGTGTVSNVALDVQALNELSEQHNWPIEFVDGFISEISVSIPWASLLSESSVVQINGLHLVIQPKERSNAGMSMFESVWSSMTSSSIHIAEECLKQTSESEQPSLLEGLDVFVQTIDSILTRVKLTFMNTFIRLEYLPRDKSTGAALEMRIKRFSYFDEAVTEAISEGATAYSSAFVTKNFTLEGVSAYTNEFHVNNRTISRNLLFESALYKDEKAEIFDAKKTISSSDSVMFAKMLGRQEIRLKVKEADNVSGPKINIEVNISSLAMFISPRQLHTICDVVYGLIMPSLQDNSNVSHHSRFHNQKPMSSFDFERVEQELIQHVNPANISNNNTRSLQNTSGWTSGGIGDDSDDDFQSVHGNKVADSLASSASSSVSSVGSSASNCLYNSKPGHSSTRYHSSKSRSKHKGVTHDPDTGGDLNVYSVRLNSLSIILLHQDLLMINAATKLPDLDSLAQLQAASNKFFIHLSSYLTSGYGHRDFDSSKQIFLDAVCHRNHFRLMSAIVLLSCEEKNDSTVLKIESTCSMADVEIIECLISSGNEPSVQYIQLLCFPKNVSINTSDVQTTCGGSASHHPNVVVHFKYISNLKRYTVPKQLDIKINFQRCSLEFDVTLIDRLKDILKNIQTFYIESLKSASNLENTYKEPSFQSMLDVRYTETKYDWNCTLPLLLIKFRFPIPDVRPLYNENESPWWDRKIYDDMLFLELSNVSIISIFTSHQLAWNLEVHCRSFCSSFQHSKSESPVRFISSCANENCSRAVDNNDSDFSVSRLVLKLYPKVSYIDLEDDVELDVMAQSVMDHGNQESSPFSSKKVMRESGTHIDGSQYSCSDGEEIILPGSKEEISDFIEDSSRNARIQIDISIPVVIIQIPSKHFLEVIYNRFSNDLLLWVPKISKPLFSGDSACSLPFMKSESLHASFSVCRPAMSCDSDSEDEVESMGRFSPYENAKTSKKNIDYDDVYGNQSKLTICVFVSQGVLDVYPNARDSTGNVIPGQYGQLQILFDEANLFNVVNHKGKPRLNFICLQMNHATLYHSSLIPEGAGFGINSIDSYPSKHLLPVIYKTSSGCILNESIPLVGTGSANSDDMLTLAIKISIDKTIKNICVANSLCCGTLRYRTQTPYCSWLIQMINFFDVKDYPIPHYQPMKVVTQLYQQFVNCTIDYRPLYLPYKAVISMENFNVSSNITAETSTSVLRFIAEEVSLFMSHKQQDGMQQNDDHDRNVNLLKDYVCVLDFGLFELSLRLTNSEGSPRVDLRASNNSFHIRTCSDSAVALMELIKYVASDGDTRNTSSTETVNSSSCSTDDSNDRADNLLINYASGLDSDDLSIHSSDDMDRVSNLMEDAINDIPTNRPYRRRENSSASEVHNEELFFFPDENNQAAGFYSEDYNCSTISSRLDSDDDDYCLIDEIESQITIYSQKAGAPEIRLLTNDAIRVVDNYFTVPITKADFLKAPKGYPSPVAKYTLREMTVVWHMYGGHDFPCVQNPSSPKHPVVPERDKCSSEPVVTFENHLSSRYSSSDSVNTLNSMTNDSDLSAINFVFRKRHRSESSNSYTGSYNSSPAVSDKLKVPTWKTQGGIKREHDVLMELQLSKLKFQYEVYPEDVKQASRYVLLIQEVEIRDRLASSNINKFLYQYYSTARPKQSNANMVVLKATNIRPEINVSNLQECCLRLSLLPLRLNIDQDSLLFLIKFMTDISDSAGSTGENADSDAGSLVEKSQHHAPVMNIENAQPARVCPSIMVQVDDKEQCACVQNSSSIFIRSFVFSPEVPVRIDYEGKRVDMSHGPVAGLIMGLGQLSCSELKLRRICNRHGFLGIDKLISFVLSEWLQDIKKKQLPSILGGVGPMYSLVQLFQGIRDLFWLPIEQYQKDGRIVRGLQRGANSFTTSTAMAALELTSRIVYAIQRIAETAFDIVSPGPSIRYVRYDRSGKKDKKLRRYKYAQPADIREGVTTALLLVKEGFGETAQTLVRVASKEHEVKGTVGAVGGVLRQIPSTALTPIIIASQATSNVLDGVKSQLIPDSRNEAALKWRKDYF